MQQSLKRKKDMELVQLEDKMALNLEALKKKGRKLTAKVRKEAAVIKKFSQSFKGKKRRRTINPGMRAIIRSFRA